MTMLPKEKQRLYKLRRRISILLLIILSLIYWVKNKYDDIDFLQFENEGLRIENSEQLSEINKLKQKVDSLTKVEKLKLEKVQIKNKINKESKKEPIIKDSIRPIIDDTSISITQDTL